MQSFNVINYDFNENKFESYDVMPYLIRCYNERVERFKKIDPQEVDLETFNKYYKVPETFEEFKTFVKDESIFQFWARCEYEIILSPWPYISSPSERYDKEGENDINAWKKHWKEHLASCDKWDVYDQIMMNLDIVTRILMENVS